jgi:hypothetical protein
MRTRAAQQRPLISPEHLANRVNLKYRVGKRPIEPRGLSFQLLQALRVRHFRSTELSLSGVVARLAEAMLPSQLLDWQPGVALAHEPNDCSSLHRLLIGPASALD